MNRKFLTELLFLTSFSFNILQCIGGSRGGRHRGAASLLERCGDQLIVRGRRNGADSVACCGGRTVYNRAASGTECCGDGTVIGSPDREGGLDCCGGRASFNRSTQICCGGEVHPGGRAVDCCGTTTYDTKKYRCEDGKVIGFNVDTCVPGRTVIVHLFDWKWTDIAQECERFLGPNEFCGVQVSPPNEHIEIHDPPRPWWERYQPISYKLGSRSGNDTQFIDMVKRCNAVGVRIYVDAVINHMCRQGSGTGTGTAGSAYNTVEMQFPGVPFGPSDFNCCECGKCGTGHCTIDDYGDAEQVRNCRLVGLLDLDLGKEYVRSKVAEYMNRLIDIGVGGFRVDAAKHMWPGDMENIYDRLKNLNTEAGFPPGTRPFIVNEVIDLGSEQIKVAEYAHLGRSTEFRYGRDLGNAFRRYFPLARLRTFGTPFGSPGWDTQPTDRAFVFIDNHDNQRGHGAGGASILTFYDGPLYRAATAFALAHPYGLLRIMSSHRWEGGPYKNDWIGPPHNPDYTIADVRIDPSTGQCEGDWVCEHRWPIVPSLVGLRNVAAGSPLRHWWDNGDHQIAFARLRRAFVAFNHQPGTAGPGNRMDVILKTGLAGGVYCDVVSGQLREDGEGCTGRNVSVFGDGTARIELDAGVSPEGWDPIIALHVGQMVTEGTPAPPTQRGNEESPALTGFQRTAVLIEFRSYFGQQLFIRGGINHEHRANCTEEAQTSACAIPIRHRPFDGSNNTDHGAGLAAWGAGDSYLDWYGEEPGQGEYNGRRALGSPTVWTTNDRQNSVAFHPLNRYGDHHWLLDVDMDCSATFDGWFDFKTYVTDFGWEKDVTQEATCGGRVGGSRPYASVNHAARCGFVNVFTFGAGDCTVDLWGAHQRKGGRMRG